MNRVHVAAAVLVVGAGCLTPTAPTRQGISTGGGSATVALSFSGQPSAAVRGQIITPRVEVTALDSLGQRAASFSGNVTVVIGTNPVGGTLDGTRTVPAVGGVASFGDLRVNRAGNGYTLTATAFGATGATSAPFSITEPLR